MLSFHQRISSISFDLISNDIDNGEGHQIFVIIDVHKWDHVLNSVLLVVLSERLE